MSASLEFEDKLFPRLCDLDKLVSSLGLSCSVSLFANGNNKIHLAGDGHIKMLLTETSVQGLEKRRCSKIVTLRKGGKDRKT